MVALMTMTESDGPNDLKIDSYKIPNSFHNLFLAYEVVNPSFCS